MLLLVCQPRASKVLLALLAAPIPMISSEREWVFREEVARPSSHVGVAGLTAILTATPPDTDEHRRTYVLANTGIHVPSHTQTYADEQAAGSSTLPNPGLRAAAQTDDELDDNAGEQPRTLVNVVTR
jgi:hypothetical protein